MQRIFYIAILVFFIGCEKWDETADISRISHLPQFELSGGEFISVQQNEEDDFSEPGVKAFVDGKEVPVFLRIQGQNLDIEINNVVLIFKFNI